MADYDLAVRKFLRLKRLERELTQRDLAALLGKPQSYVSKIETGERAVSVGEFIELSQALKFDLRSAIRKVAGDQPKPP